jgi:hypothetical protein
LSLRASVSLHLTFASLEDVKRKMAEGLVSHHAIEQASG